MNILNHEEPVFADGLVLLPRVEYKFLCFRFAAYLLIATLLPLSLLLLCLDYALFHNIKLEQGCHGPGVSFGLLSGLLFALQLRILR